MKIPGVILDEKPAAGGALPCRPGNFGDEQADLVAGLVALDGGVTAVFDQPVESFEKRIPLLVGNEMGLVGQVVRPVVDDFSAVTLDFHGNHVGGGLLTDADMLREKASGRQESDGGEVFSWELEKHR